MTSLHKHFVLKLIFIFFLTLFTYQSFKTMIDIPFYDFDEAHRAENAKRMKEYKSFFVPLTGSSQDRVEHLKIPFKQNHDFYIYYHLERPPLVYILMMISTSIFGEAEWAYRLPSFVMGMLIIVVFFIFARKETKKEIESVSVGILVLFASGCLWLSSQYAQMDTTITLFLFLSLLTLILYCSNKKTILGFLSGIFFGLGLLSKLQPAVIFIFPVLYLFLAKKLRIAGLFLFLGGFLTIFLPWIIYLSLKFGLRDVFYILPGFAINSASIINIHHQAPVFWYLRWWWEMLRPGWTIFLALTFYEITSGLLDWKKKTLLSYIFGGLLIFSIPSNKVWWYVLPLVPAIAYFIFLSIKDYLQKNSNRIINISFALILASVPMFLKASNTQVLIYGFFISLIVYLILTDKINLKINFTKHKKPLFYLSLIISMLFFYTHFPEIIPYHYNAKNVAQYYKNLPYPKCLWLGDMPGEAVLFYSEAGEVPLLNQGKGTQVFKNCVNNYLITPEKSKEGDLVYRRGNIRLYKF